ncbi:MAG: hypothetical protein K2X38_21150 [Gemmataceae bacterium]|nr:hypothetical protein [Gemmataceae bacterium]
MLPSKLVQRLGGCLLFLAGLAVTAWTWHSALIQERFSTRLGGLGPVVAIGGLSLMLMPMDIDWLRRTHGVHKPYRFAHYPPAWKAVMVLALIAGIANYLALTRM